MAPRNNKKELLFNELDGKIKQGGLRRQLRLKKNDRLTKADVAKMARVAEGKSFEFNGNQFKMTKLMKKRVLLAKNMMK